MKEVKSPLFIFVEKGTDQPPIRARSIPGTLCRRKRKRPNLTAGLIAQDFHGLVPAVGSIFLPLYAAAVGATRFGPFIYQA
jgi:hypothetical protein